MCFAIVYLMCSFSFVYFHFFLDFIFAVDIISAIEFDKSGDHLATGDRGGRVVLFERTDTRDVSQSNADFSIVYTISMP